MCRAFAACELEKSDYYTESQACTPTFSEFSISGSAVNVLAESEERDDVKIKPIKLELLEDDRLQHTTALYCPRDVVNGIISD